jgi:hypothetical protein
MLVKIIVFFVLFSNNYLLCIIMKRHPQKTLMNIEEHCEKLYIITYDFMDFINFPNDRSIPTYT